MVFHYAKVGHRTYLSISQNSKKLLVKTLIVSALT